MRPAFPAEARLFSDERLKANMRFLCDESRMLTGVTVAYGTPVHSEWTQYGRAQELTRTESGFLPAVRPLQPDTIYDLASLTKLFTAVVTLALVESAASRWMNGSGRSTRALPAFGT